MKLTILDNLERQIVAVDGCDLTCWHRPGNDQKWVLWLHGAGMQASMWSQQMDQFDGVDLIFMDVRGQGESALHSDNRVRFADTVNDIGAVLDIYGIKRVTLIGHSWGGNPAQEFAYRHSDRIDALVMVGAWGQLRPMTKSELRKIRIMGRLYRMVPWKFTSTINARACSDGDSTRSLVTEMLRSTGREIFIDLGLSAYEEVHDVDSYPVHTPTLLVRGSDDYPTRLGPIYEQICAKNPAAREAVIAGTRHMPMIDTPDEFNDIIREFLGIVTESTS